MLTTKQAQGEELIRAIRRVAGMIEREKLAQQCISDLPPDEVEEGQPSEAVRLIVEQMARLSPQDRAELARLLGG